MSEAIHWTNETRRLDELQPWPRNPRLINKDQAKRLAQSFDEFGQVETIAIGPEGQVYNGHQRLSVLMDKHGGAYEVEVRVSSRALTEKEREKLTVFLHKGAAGEWDFDTLANEFEFEELVAWGFDEKELLGAGFEQDEPEGEDPGAQVDKAEELRQKWGVETGQLWKLGEHRLICGDCTDRAVVEKVMGGEKADMVSADPPFGLGLFEERSAIGLSKEYGEVVGDKDVTTAIRIFRAVDDPSAKQVWWGANHWGHEVISNSPCWLVWDKDHHGMTFADGEMAWTNIKSPMRILCHTWSGADRDSEKGEERYHVNQKPVALFEWYFELFTKRGEIVLDPCCGVGGSLIACERLSRKCRAVEISPAYCAVAIQRWVDMTGGVPELIS